MGRTFSERPVVQCLTLCPLHPSSVVCTVGYLKLTEGHAATLKFGCNVKRLFFYTMEMISNTQK